MRTVTMPMPPIPRSKHPKPIQANLASQCPRTHSCLDNSLIRCSQRKAFKRSKGQTTRKLSRAEPDYCQPIPKASKRTESFSLRIHLERTMRVHKQSHKPFTSTEITPPKHLGRPLDGPFHNAIHRRRNQNQADYGDRMELKVERDKLTNEIDLQAAITVLVPRFPGIGRPIRLGLRRSQPRKRCMNPSRVRSGVPKVEECRKAFSTG